jgi:hypothetical protein
MYQQEIEEYASVYFENNSLGVCVFSKEELLINCGQIVHFCLPDKHLLFEKLSQCSSILTNQPKNPVLSLL